MHFLNRCDILNRQVVECGELTHKLDAEWSNAEVCGRNQKKGGEGLTGEHQHSLDAKGRLFIPAKLREALGLSFYICKGMDYCLSVYSLEAWGKMEEKLSEMPQSQSRVLKRMLFPTAQKCDPDGQGRVLLSSALREYAGLEKNAVVVGVGDHAEIWAAEKWAEQCGNFTEGSLEEAMNLLGL